MVSPPEVHAFALRSDIRLVQVTGDVGRQRSTGSGGVLEEEVGREDVNIELDQGCQNHVSVEDAIYVAAPDQVDINLSMKLEKIIKR